VPISLARQNAYKPPFLPSSESPNSFFVSKPFASNQFIKGQKQKSGSTKKTTGQIDGDGQVARLGEGLQRADLPPGLGGEAGPVQEHYGPAVGWTRVEAVDPGPVHGQKVELDDGHGLVSSDVAADPRYTPCVVCPTPSVAHQHAVLGGVRQERGVSCRRRRADPLRGCPGVSPPVIA
jgi:hypothetical protein